MGKNKFYVYTVSVKGAVVYVGKGKGDRINHVTSGYSHNYGLNELYFRHKLLGEDLPSIEIEYCISEKIALSLELLKIKQYNPEYNTALKTTDVEFYDHHDDECILEFMENRGDNISMFDIPSTSNLSDNQIREIYANICEYENPSVQDLTFIATFHSNIYGTEISCEYISALLSVRYEREGV